MRIKTPVTKENIKNHMTYSLWKYVLMAVLVMFGWSLIYTTTAYRSPQNKRIDVYIQSYTASTETADAFMEPVWKEMVPEMETVASVIMPLIDDYNTGMQIMAYVAAGDIDIFFMNEQYFKTYAGQGLFLPLEEMVENGTINVSDVDLTTGYVTMVEEYDENERPVKTSRHLFGIPLDSFYGFMGGMQLDNRGMYACVLTNNHNDENVIPFFNALLQAGRGEKEEWITE